MKVLKVLVALTLIAAAFVGGYIARAVSFPVILDGDTGHGGAPAVSRLMSVTPLDPPTPLIRNPQDAKSRNKERTARGHQLCYFLVEMNALTESASGEGNTIKEREFGGFVPPKMFDD